MLNKFSLFEIHCIDLYTSTRKWRFLTSVWLEVNVFIQGFDYEMLNTIFF